MSCSDSSCANTSNNKHFSCPPRMSDGRHFTDYRPNCHLNNLVRANNVAHNSFQYRMFLTHNATALQEENRAHACQKNCCGPCQSPYSSGTMMREKRASITPTDVPGHRGVPCGNTISSNPLVDAHTTQPLTCAQWSVGHANRLLNCCQPVRDSANALPAYGTPAAVRRLSVPGGGVPLRGGDPNFYS